MPAGGYQRPANPAPASGPGSLARRTDGGTAQKLRDLPNAAYGEQATYKDLQRAAPLAQTPQGSGAAGVAPAGPSVVPFHAPTDRPDEPITSGVDVGPGPGMDSLGLPSQDPSAAYDLERIRLWMPALKMMANKPGSSASSRNFVRKLQAML